MNRRLLALFLISFGFALAFSSCSNDKENGKRSSRRKNKRTPVIQTRFVRPDSVSHDFVGSEACRDCHAEIMKEYESHAMSRSMAVTSKSDIENYQEGTLVKTSPSLQFEVKKNDGKVVHTELVRDATGELISEHPETIDFTCGSGTRGCSYLIFRDGKMYQSPITWYGKSGKWDLSPGYHPPQYPRFERMVSDGCFACHAGNMNRVENERATFKAPEPFLELSIGCERCHGPGKEHIAFHNTKEKADLGEDPIVNPEKLDSARRDAVCYQCHLQGVKRVTRYGRSEYDFRPGMLISDVWIPFLKTGETIRGKADAVSQVEQMRNSECFIQSKGDFGCISCHDPHSSPAADTQVEFYRQKCLNCHINEPAETANEKTSCSVPLSERMTAKPANSCVQCHMPKLNAGDVPHTSQTDHRVQRPNDGFTYQAESELDLRIWLDGDVPKHAVERAKTIFYGEQSSDSRNMMLAEKGLEGLNFFHPPAKDDLILNEALARIYQTQGEVGPAIQYLNNSLQQNPRDEFVLQQMANTFYNAGQYKESYQFFKRLIELNDSRPQTLLSFLDVCTKVKKIEEGIEIAKRILELNPGSLVTHQWLVVAFERQGDKEKVKHHQQIVEKLKAVSEKR